MTHASVFSGIGGPEVAASMLGWENLFHCEINPFGRKVLDYWYPNAKSYEDITTTDFTEWRGRVDVLTGGFPCQPFSYAGRRRGAEDDRYLWSSMYRAIDEIQPTWVVAENVAGILTMVEQGEVSKVAGAATLFDALDDLRGRYELRETFTLQRICTDLESHGYAVQPVLVPACAVGAPHRRDRVFIVARRIASDTYDRADRRTAREDEGKGREERIQERHEVRKPDEPNQVRREGANDVTSYTDNAGAANIGGAIGDERRTACEDWREGLRQAYGKIGTSGADATSSHAPYPDSHRGCEVDEHLESELADGTKPVSNGGQRNVADTFGGRISGRSDNGEQCDKGHHGQHQPSGQPFGIRHQQGWVFDGWCDSDCAGLQRWQAFPSVSTVHRGNDGIPFDVDRLTLSFGKWRTEALKAYGNAIVPQVMYEIFRSIEQTENELSNQ